MSEILNQIERDLWEERNWELALKTKDPVGHFKEYLESSEEADTPIDELPNKDWLRAT